LGDALPARRMSSQGDVEPSLALRCRSTFMHLIPRRPSQRNNTSKRVFTVITVALVARRRR
jgi:hypothetical protein